MIIDIYSRYVVGWTVAATETSELAREFIADTTARHGIERDQLALHADRGTSMTSKPVAQLLIDLGVDRSHSRPHVSNDNPYSEANFKTLKYCPAFPGRFGSIEDARAFCTVFFELLQPPAPPFRGRPAHRRVGALRHRHRDPGPTRRHAGRRLRRKPRQIPAPAAHPTETAYRRLDQPTHPRSAHQIRVRNCLTGLDMFRQRSARSRSSVQSSTGGGRRRTEGNLVADAHFICGHAPARHLYDLDHARDFRKFERIKVRDPFVN